MGIPLILAGPILRRVEPGLVSVWLALSEAATMNLTLNLWATHSQLRSWSCPQCC